MAEKSVWFDCHTWFPAQCSRWSRIHECGHQHQKTGSHETFSLWAIRSVTDYVTPPQQSAQCGPNFCCCCYRIIIINSLCIQSPSVQFWDWSTSPSQSFPPFLGAGLLHSLLLHWVHSVPQADHLLQSVHTPSTREERTKCVRNTESKQTLDIQVNRLGLGQSKTCLGVADTV